MTEYIELTDLWSAPLDYIIDTCGSSVAQGFIDRVNEIKPADVRPVVRGRWELAEDGWYCTACELYPPFDCDPEEKGVPLCPWCGADMRGEG